MTETEGEKTHHGGKRTENRRKENGQNMKNTHLSGGCHVVVSLLQNWGNFEILKPNLPTTRGLSLIDTTMMFISASFLECL